jgi:outer membrane protein assembly factor BamE (lipoprotein component of BamABCDE complex)
MIKEILHLSRWIAIAAIPIATLSSCAEMTTVPNYVTPTELSNLNSGMSKEQVRSSLANLYPHDILASDETGCEIVMYKYKTPAKKTPGSYAKKERGLTEGDKYYTKENNAYLFFKNGYLETVLTGAGQGDALPLLENMDAFVENCQKSDGGMGCTDPEALNFDELAIIDNGKCEYCPCGSILNPAFNPKRPVSDCNTKCLSSEEKKQEPGCTNCDILKQLMDSKANINLNMTMPSFPDNNGSNTKAPAAKANEKKTTEKPSSKTSNSKESDNKSKSHKSIF